MAAEHEWMSWVSRLPDPIPAIREFAVQYHYFSLHQIVAFSRALGSLSPENRRALSRVASVIVDELGPADRDEAHSMIFERFAISVGVPSAELPPPGGRVHRNVRAYIKALNAAFSSGTPANVLGAYLFLESSAVQGYAPMLRCLKALNLAGADLTFFEVHANLEPSHLKEAEELVAGHALDTEQTAVLEWQKERLSNHWEAFWQGIQEACEAAIAADPRPHPQWRSDSVFQRLCDMVASDRLVCLTGAGVSARLPRALGKRLLPSWPQLLRELREAIHPRVSQDALREIDDILDSVWPSGRLLIQAAAILRAADPELFDQTLTQAVTPKPGTTSDTHAALCELRPRGIVTFNYDSAHESAARARAIEYEILTPSVEDQPAIVAALASGLNAPFLLKAHGSIDHHSDDLILTAESYRELMVRRPAYRALVQHILTEFHLLILGFGMSDPDFDLLIDTLVDSYGAPVRDSVVILHRREEGPREVLLRRRYGINTLYVDSFADIPAILREACSWPGPAMTAALNKSLASGSTHARSNAHAELRLLGPAGRALASNALRRELETSAKIAADPAAEFRTSELVYTLGVLTERMNAASEQTDWIENKQAIMQIVDNSNSADPIARALTVLRPLLRPDDLPKIQTWQSRFHSPPFVEQPHQRLAVYADYLQVYIAAKYNSEPRA